MTSLPLKAIFLCVSTHKLPGRLLKLLTGEFFLSCFFKVFMMKQLEVAGAFKYFLYVFIFTPTWGDDPI